MQRRIAKSLRDLYQAAWMARIMALVCMTILLAPIPAQAASPGTAAASTVPDIECGLPESNAEGLMILHDYYAGYWWDHTDLTVAVQAHPNATEEQLEAIHEGIATWTRVLEECFGGLITLTDVTGEGRNPQQAADIVVHYVPHFGGNALGGNALCGKSDCANIILGSERPPGIGEEPFSPQFLSWLTQHELGHALGLGHATNISESTDLMGYGWPTLGDPVLSDCDVDALAYVFAWVFEGGEPHPPAPGPFPCEPA
jgi:hypothetical protein